MTIALLVDIGNSAIKWTASEAPALIGPVNSRIHRDQDLLTLLDQHWSGMRKPDVIWVASVAGCVGLQHLSSWTRRSWGIDPVTVSSEPLAFGVQSGYVDYRLLGVDRWLAMIAAFQRCARACCVVDCGTAATVDVVNAQGVHLGGYILPGVHSSRRALLEFTKIPRIKHTGTTSDIGVDTATAVELGGRLAVVGVIKHAMNVVRGNDPSAGLFVAGSEAGLLRQWLPQETQWAPHLVLEGLAHYAKRGI